MTTTALDGRAAVHLDHIIRDVIIDIRTGRPARSPEVRLIAAADFADVLDAS